MEESSLTPYATGPDRLLQSLKRQTVPTACYNCRSKKVKCDGRSPCIYCSRRSLACSYESTLADETPRQAKKRKYQELTQRSGDFQELYNILAGKDEAKATEVFRRIRGGEDLESVISHIKHGDLQQVVLSTPGQKLQRLFLTSLVKSTATIRAVAFTWTAFVANSTITLPLQEAYEPLRDRIVTLEELSGILTNANPPASTEVPIPPPSISAMNVLSGPLYWVPAQPWLMKTSDEEASHLLSLFLSYLNHSWRFVEAQPFLEAMRSRDLYRSTARRSRLALEHDTERGIQCHNEALRLRDLAELELSITNVQSLMILAVECIIRGMDDQGLGLLASGTSLNGLLPTVKRSSNMTKAEMLYMDVRGCAWWMVVRVDLTYKVGLMLGGDVTDWDLAPPLEDAMPDTLKYWIGYPLRDEPIPFRANLLFRHQCRFTRLLWEATKILIWDPAVLDARLEHARAVRQLSTQLEDWHQNLPSSLHFVAQMPPSLYDMHTQYHYIQMALHERTYVQMFRPMHNTVGDLDALSDPENEELKAHLRTKTLQHCYRGAASIRTFRETYGLKWVPFVLLNHSIMGVFICLNDIHANPQALNSHSTNETGPIQDTIAALEEFFRVLLATSLRWTLSRGLARMAYYTATEELRIKLPSSIDQMTRIIAASFWQAADLKQLTSMNYPNWSMPHVHDTNFVENYRMGDLLKKWKTLDIRQPETLDSPLPFSRRGAAYDPVRD